MFCYAIINDFELRRKQKFLRNKRLFKKFYDTCKLHEANHSEDYYYQIRDLDRKKTAYAKLTMYEKAARCVYLNKACFNGLYRVNGKGQFNVPSGKYEKIKCFDEENIQALHKYFHKRKPVILNKDFAEAVKTAKTGDLVYFDPPYDVVGEQSFTSYTTGGFNKKEQERIATLIRKNIADIITYELKNPNLGFVTISEVKVSSDFSYAKVYVSFILEKDIKPGLEVLEHSKGFIRSSLAKKMDTRRIPELSFVLDDGYKKEERITELLKK